MSATVSDDLLRRFGPAEDPAIEARRQKILRFLLDSTPHIQQELIEKGVEKGLVDARSALRGVLEQRQLALTPDHEARIDQCTDFAILVRWSMQAATAATAAEALK